MLGAGGVTGGAFHAGVLAALAEVTGWDPRTADVVIGTSAGSATAAALRAGLSAPDMAARARGETLSDEGRMLLASAGVPTGPAPVPTGARIRLGRPAAPEILLGALRRPWRTRPTALIAGLAPAGAVPTDTIVDSIDALHPRGWPAAPTWVCAVRLRDGALVVFGRDDAPTVPIGKAVAASCAIPGYFTPVEIDAERYADGGAHSLTNVGEAMQAQPDLVIVSSPMSRYGAGRAQLAVEAQALRRRGTEVVALRPTPEVERAMGVNAMDPTRRAAVVRAAHESTRRHLETIRDRLTVLG